MTIVILNNFVQFHKETGAIANKRNGVWKERNINILILNSEVYIQYCQFVIFPKNIWILTKNLFRGNFKNVADEC